MAAPIGVAFAHVEDHEIVALPADPPRKLLQRHERNGRRRLGQKLPHRLAARDIGAKRFGQMTRRAEIEPAHHLDEGGALALLKPRSEETRVGKECCRTCRSRWWQYH